ncbi:hypothetical protein L6270_01775 [Candidatus Parcubacteria bacterium]|nr:hypothetical protein [Patescibacteria group bacterium]MBU4309869.1 hypothetical protein [Patescibacteria group bacterium]MBU4431720.1 hypothetical protein [Patescibacteria group bacterium]MBU4578208.1 hypothetical protein [Patescibacteria group bacterium]MCG2696744.1 hypothetical protein [Candidatus Parcubacteria bacterium]
MDKLLQLVLSIKNDLLIFISTTPGLIIFIYIVGLALLIIYIRGELMIKWLTKKLYQLRFWLHSYYAGKNENHYSLSVDVKLLFLLNEKERKKYYNELDRRRGVVFKRGLKKNGDKDF